MPIIDINVSSVYFCYKNEYFGTLYLRAEGDATATTGAESASSRRY